MKNYRVSMVDVAEEEVKAHFEHIGEWDAVFAQRWLEGLLKRLDKLTLFPSGYPTAPEDTRYDVTVRSLLYHGPSGKKGGAVFRILFHIVEADGTDEQGYVRVLRVLHGAQKPDNSE